MEYNNSAQIMQDIIEKAQQQKFTKFHLLTSWVEYTEYSRYYLSTKLVIKMLKTTAKRLSKTYCKMIKAGASDITVLQAYFEVLDYIEFYKKELAILLSMVNEYDDYLWSGHFVYSYFGGERDLYDE